MSSHRSCVDCGKTFTITTLNKYDGMRDSRCFDKFLAINKKSHYPLNVTKQKTVESRPYMTGRVLQKTKEEQDEEDAWKYIPDEYDESDDSDCEEDQEENEKLPNINDMCFIDMIDRFEDLSIDENILIKIHACLTKQEITSLDQLKQIDGVTPKLIEKLYTSVACH
jgi:DNA uptake protein ComE-like DNA-binding protein